MDDKVLKFWTIKENPFSNDITNKHLFHRSPQYDETINRIHNGIREQNTDITMIYGEVGTGKSYTSVILFSELKALGYYTLYIPKSYDNFETLMCRIVRELTVEKPTHITAATLLFEDLLAVIEQQKTQLVLILDECHSYNVETLDKIRQLSNYNAQSSKKLLSLVLVGQTELIIKTRNDIKQLYSRAKIKQYLEYLKEDEVEEYINFKMRAVGYAKRKKNPFSPYIQEIYDATLGMQRLINNTCEAILELSARKEEIVISKETVKSVISEITFDENSIWSFGGTK